MKTLRIFTLSSLLTGMLLFSGCSNDEILSSDGNLDSISLEDKSALDFVAVLTPEQEANFNNSGEVFLPEQQKNAWNAIIDKDIPASWGLFDSPFKKSEDPQTRAVGIWGSYPAQYWTMIRLKNGPLPTFILGAMTMAVKEMETNTNVRFYNSSKDDESITIGGTTIKLPNVKVNMQTSTSQIEGTGNFGLIGGEQIVWVPQELNNPNKYTQKEVAAFLMHAFCNAAGMFNEQQRKDRDDFVQIYDSNIKPSCKVCFTKQNSNYTMQGTFDMLSITLASSKAYSINPLSSNTILKKGGGLIAKNLELSNTDKYFLNDFYLPYIGRTDNWIELDTIVYYRGSKLSESERIQLQNRLNADRGLYGTPPANGRIERKPWS